MDSLKESVALHLLRFLLYANGLNPASEAREKKKNVAEKFSAKLRVSHLKCREDGGSYMGGFSYRGWSPDKEGRRQALSSPAGKSISGFVSGELRLPP